MITQFQLVKEGKARGFAMPMDKLRSLNQEFPWLYTLLKTLPGHIYVMQATTNIFDLPVIRTGTGFTWDPHRHEEIYLLDESGAVIVHTHTMPIRVKRWGFFGPLVDRTWNFEAEGKMTIGESWAFGNVFDLMKHMGESVGRIRYILSFHKGTGAAIIYRIAKDTTAQNLMDAHLPAAPAA